jgi:hypothetical protein
MTEKTAIRKIAVSKYFSPVVRFWSTLKQSQHPAMRAVRYGGYRLYRWSAELTALLLGAAFVWLYGLNVLLAQEELDISFLKPNASAWFSGAFDGNSADVGTMLLSWQSGSNEILFNATDVQINDRSNSPVQSIKSLEVSMDFHKAMAGIADPREIAVEGGSVTWKRDENGNVIAGLGTPNSVGNFGTFTSAASNSARRDAPNFDIGTLHQITATNAKVFLVDAKTGINLAFENTDLTIIREDKNFRLTTTSELLREGTNTSLNIDATFSPDLEDVDLAFDALGVSPDSFVATDQFSWIKMPLDFIIAIKAKRGVGLTDFSLSANSGGGTLIFEEDVEVVTDFNLNAQYNKQGEVLELKDIRYASGKYQFGGEGNLANIGSLTSGLFKENIGLDLSFSGVRLDLTPELETPLEFDAVSLKGTTLRESNGLSLEAVEVDFGDFQIVGKGGLSRDKDGAFSGLSGAGQVNGVMGPDDLLALWPVNFAGGARRWIERSILQGKVSNIEFVFDIDGETLKQGPLQNEDVRLSFTVLDGETRYISTMTPLTNISGAGILRGNSFEFDAISGNVGGLVVDTVKVDIPRLSPKGGDLTIDITGQGNVEEMLSLIDQEPFKFASRYNILPSNFGGAGTVDVTITRPLLEYFDQDRILYDVAGSFSGVRAPFQFGSASVTGGTVSLKADKTRIEINGPVQIGGWEVDLSWLETFDESENSTQYAVRGRVDRDVLDNLGLGLRQYFDGYLDVEFDATGKGLNISQTSFKTDLSTAEMRLGDYWMKPMGAPGTASGMFSRNTQGGIRGDDISVNAAGLALNGDFEFAPDFRLIGVNMERAKVDGFMDAQFALAPSAAGTHFDINGRGKYVDVSDFISRAMSAQPSGVAIPFNLNAEIDQLVLNPAYIVNQAKFDVDYDGEKFRTGGISGQVSGGDFTAKIQSDGTNGGRRLSLNVPDASLAALAFYGVTNLKNGKLTLEASLPGDGSDKPLNGNLSMTEFSVLNVPILARMLSLASLEGLANTLSGSGLRFNSLDLPFSFREGKLSVRNARASGPALGMTGDGEIYVAQKAIDLDGVLVPAYTANSALGAIPVIGDIFVGKKGEGIFALNYSIAGPFSKTQVAINPLSALTPGFLRRIFDPDREDIAELDTEAETVIVDE